MELLFKVCRIAAFLFSVLLILTDCQKSNFEENNDNDLYSEMLEYARHLESYKGTISMTKSGESTSIDTAIDINTIDDKFLQYIDLYTESNDVSSWNERNVLCLVNNDSRFSPEDKSLFAKGIACVYLMKKDTYRDSFSTKTEQNSDEERNDCYEVYDKDYRRACRNGCIAFFFALLEPSVYGEIAAYVYLASSLLDVEEDLADCLEEIEE